MKVEPHGDPEKLRFIRRVIQSFEVQVPDRPVRTVVATARSEKDLEGVQSDIEAWLSAYSVLNAFTDPKESSRIFPHGDPYLYSKIFIDRLAEVEEGWKDRHVKVWGLRRVLRQR